MKLIKLTEMDEAEISLEMRNLYKDIGFNGCIQVLYEIISSANVMAVVMMEEKLNEEKKKRMGS